MNYHRAKFCTNLSTNMDLQIFFHFLRIFQRNLEYFNQKKRIFFFPFQLCIIANIVS